MKVAQESDGGRNDDADRVGMLRDAFAMLDREHDPECVAQVAIDVAVQLGGAELGVLLHQPDGAGGYLRHAVSGILPNLPESATSEVVVAHLLPCSKGSETERWDDVHQRLPADSPLLTSGIRSCLAVPVALAGGTPLARIVLGHSRAGMFDASAELALAALAAYVARVLEPLGTAPMEPQTAGFGAAVEQRVGERTEELRRNELQLERLISGIADYAIFLLDADGLVQTWNTGAERSTGYAAAEIIGRHFSCFYTPEDRIAGAPAHSLATARDKGIYEAEGWRIRKDGTRYWASALLDAIHDGDGQVVGFAKVTRDMTERRALEEHLHQSRRMEAIGRLTGGVAHDFNNLLTVILGNLDTICRETASMPRLHTAADDAIRAAKRSATLTRQLLAFSRRQPLNPQPTDVNRLVGSVSGLLRRTFGETIAIATDLDVGVDVALARVDATQLESALINLAMNARDVMPDGGVLAISTTLARLADPDSGVLQHRNPRDYILIAVADSGPGMTEEVREHAFEPFFTTKPSGRGTGLGLSQVYGFVRQSGGHVRIRSDPGHGTTVTIALPRLESGDGHVTADEPGSAPAHEAAIPATATILLVEDNDGVRRFSAAALRDLGFSVIEAADAESALERLDAAPAVDLLFTDIGLPRMSGDRLAEEALRRRPGLRVLYTTGYAPDAIAHLPGLVEGVNLLRKPYMREQALERIRAILAGPAGALPAFRLLVVEDDALLRDLTARMLAEMQVEVHVAGSVAGVRSLVAQGRDFDAALVDLDLGDGHGREAAQALRSRQPDLPIILTSGFGEAELARVELAGDVDLLRKPYGREELRRLVTGIRAAAV